MNLPLTQLTSLRAKKLGVLLREARLAAGKSLEDCAQAIGAPAATIEAYEFGARSPSLPELENLAYTLKAPVEHFWGDQPLAARIGGRAGGGAKADLKQVIRLRQRMVGARLRQYRQQAGLSLADLGARANVEAGRLESYELGEAPIPLPDLESLSAALDRTVQEFGDQQGPVGAWSRQQQTVQGFLALPPELQTFIARPVNRPYLELAQRLSELPAEKLRAIAESLLAITY